MKGLHHKFIMQSNWFENLFFASSIFKDLVPQIYLNGRSNPSQPPPLLMHVGKWPAVMLSIKSLADVAPEMGLRECTLCLPRQRANKALELRGDLTRNPKQGYQWLQNTTFVSVRQKLKKQTFLKFVASWVRKENFNFNFILLYS